MHCHWWPIANTQADCLRGTVNLLSNVEALEINLPESSDNCGCGKKCTVITPLLAYVSFYKMYARGE